MVEEILIGKIMEKSLFKVNVNKFKKYEGPLPIIKPTKALTQEELDKIGVIVEKTKL